MNSIQNQEYSNWVVSLKSTIKQRQIKAAIAVNSNLIMLYWDLGKQIVEKQENTKWGSGFIDQLSKDLKSEFPDMGGLSVTNIKLCRQFYLFYRSDFLIRQQLVGELKIGQQVVGELENSTKLEENSSEDLIECFQIPWGHNVIIIQKIKNQKEAFFYINQTIQNNWSRSVLEYQIETNLYSRQGSAVNNFSQTLHEIQGDLAKELLKDPYNFEFLTLSSQAKEKDLEQKFLIANFNSNIRNRKQLTSIIL